MGVGSLVFLFLGLVKGCWLRERRILLTLGEGEGDKSGDSSMAMWGLYFYYFLEECNIQNLN